MVLAKSAACLGIIFENENAFLGLEVLFRPALLRPNASALGRVPAARLNFIFVVHAASRGRAFGVRARVREQCCRCLCCSGSKRYPRARWRLVVIPL